MRGCKKAEAIGVSQQLGLQTEATYVGVNIGHVVENMLDEGAPVLLLPPVLLPVGKSRRRGWARNADWEDVDVAVAACHLKYQSHRSGPVGTERRGKSTTARPVGNLDVGEVSQLRVGNAPRRQCGEGGTIIELLGTDREFEDYRVSLVQGLWTADRQRHVEPEEEESNVCHVVLELE